MGKVLRTGIDGGDDWDGPRGCHLAADLGSQGIMCHSALFNLLLGQQTNLACHPCVCTAVLRHISAGFLHVALG